MFSVLILNGGIGSRVGADRAKQFIKIHGQPILMYSLKIIDQIPEITEIVINHPPGARDLVESLFKDHAIQTPAVFVEAGQTRHDSVARLVIAATNQHVIVHEAARPLVTKEDFLRLIQSDHDNVALMQPIPFTVAPVNPDTKAVTGSLERDLLRNVQLPQKFVKEHLDVAHRRAAQDEAQFTEDATLVHAYGFPVHFIEGTDQNIKVTTPTDLKIAAVLLAGND